MKPIAKFFVAASAATLCAQAAAQGTYKCKDAAGKITYAGKECSLLGLMPGGEITGTISVQPPLAVPKSRPAAPPAPEPAAADEPPEKKARDPGAEAVVGEDGRRCFKTAKGTRCNDAAD